MSLIFMTNINRALSMHLSFLPAQPAEATFRWTEKRQSSTLGRKSL